MSEVAGRLPWRRIRFTALLSLLAMLSCARPETDTFPDIVLTGIPDLPQQGPDFGLPGDGSTLCAPVAVSNSLSWLLGASSQDDQVALVRRLAGEDYMATLVEIGTPFVDMVRGLERYLDEEGISYRRLEYAGWHRVPPRYRAKEPLSLAWLLRGLSGHSAVWLNLGWYDNALPGYYRRRSGHWVTLVGHRNGRLIIHDPGPWAADVDPQVLETRTVRPLVLRTAYRSLFPAPLLIELVGARSPNEKRAYVDGALILELDGERLNQISQPPLPPP